jgi:tetratricopeptide (TPR) repeat protein
MAMIPTTTAPIASPMTNPTVPADHATHEAQVHERAAPEMQGAEQPGGSPRLPASHELHAQVQNAAYGAPQGTGGASGAGAPPAVDPRKAAQAHMDHGNAALKARDYKQAIESYREAYRLVPSPKILMNLGSALRDAGQYAEAVVVYEQYLSDPSRDPTRDGEVRTAMEGARARLGGNTYTADDIAKSKGEMARGLEAVRAGRYDEALEAFRSAHAHNPLPEFLHNQAFCLEKLNAPMSAAKFYREFAEATPNKGEASQARASAVRLSAHGASAPITATGLAGGMEWMQRGNQLLMAHKYEQALAAFQEGFRTYPDSKFILNEAAALNGAGRYAEADLAYQRYLSNPDAPRADEAREAQQRLRVDHMGGREATITGVAESKRLMEEFGTLYKAGKYGEAFDALERAHALNPLSILRHDQAVCLTAMGKPELAAQFYERYLQEAPNAPNADIIRRKVTQLHGEALNLATQAFERGHEAFKAGRTQEAASAFIEAYSHKPLPQFLYNAGASYHKGGDNARAIEYYQRYLNAAPDAPDAAKVRTTIDKLHQANGSALIDPRAIDPADQRIAQRAFDRGLQAWNEGRFVDASKAFAEAYKHAPRPALLYNVAASLDKAGDTQGAVRVYQEYLNADPGAKDAERVKTRIHQLLDRVGAGLMKPE